MGLDLLETNLKYLHDPEFILFLRTSADKLEAHPALKEFPDHVPGPPRFRELADLLQHAVEAAKGGDKDRKEEKKALRAEGNLAQIITAAHIAMIYHHTKDPSVLLNTGWELKHRAAYGKGPGRVGPPPLPAKYSVKHGPASGTLVVTVGKGPSNTTLEVSATTDDPVVESSWYTVDIYRRCRIVLKGLEPAKKYHFRMRYRNDDEGVGPWTPPTPIIVI